MLIFILYWRTQAEYINKNSKYIKAKAKKEIKLLFSFKNNQDPASQSGKSQATSA
jgi:hypothetical protein